MNADLKTLIVVILVPVFLLSGCTLLSRYGSLSPESGFNSGITIDTLRKDWNDFHVSYAGMSLDNATGILFDPIHDDKKIMGNSWKEVTHREELSKLIFWIDARNTDPRPRLSRILDAKGDHFGYIYSPLSHATLKVIDEKTLYVYDMEIPDTFRPRRENDPFSGPNAP